MHGITVYEFDVIVASLPDAGAIEGLHAVPGHVFKWLEEECLRTAEAGDTAWLRLTQRRGHRAVQVTSYVGVMRSPDGFQIEVLPKVGKAIGGGAVEARQLLVEMLRCLNGFRHIRTDSAKLTAARMPLLEVFIGEFLQSVQHIVKRGLRSDYRHTQDNLFSLRGKLMTSQHLRQNLFRADRFFTEHDEFTTDRPENRLLHAALRRLLLLTSSQQHQKLARELCFVFADIPPSVQVRTDFQKVRVDRGMGYYADALAWARLILDEESPLTGSGQNQAPSLLFPMAVVFEAFVAKHLAKQLLRPLTLKTQAQSQHLVQHKGLTWFRLKPDLLVRNGNHNMMVLDTKWKLLDMKKPNGSDKYGLSQSDFYQLQAYGLSYLGGDGSVTLIYPKTDALVEPLPVFDYLGCKGLKLWVLPFCLKTKRLVVPENTDFPALFSGGRINTIKPADMQAVRTDLEAGSPAA